MVDQDGFSRVPITDNRPIGLKYASLVIAARIDRDNQLVVRVEDGRGHDLIANVEAGPRLAVALAIYQAIGRAIEEHERG